MGLYIWKKIKLSFKYLKQIFTPFKMPFRYTLFSEWVPTKTLWYAECFEQARLFHLLSFGTSKSHLQRILWQNIQFHPVKKKKLDSFHNKKITKVDLRMFPNENTLSLRLCEDMRSVTQMFIIREIYTWLSTRYKLLLPRRSTVIFTSMRNHFRDR